MTVIQNDHVVEIDYTLKNDKGDVLDSSKKMGPLSFIQGKKNIIPGLESKVNGKKLGDVFNVTISPEEAYGLRDEAMVQSVPKSEFGPDANNVKVGQQFEVQNQNGQVMLVRVTEVNESNIVIDANHPMAGKTLYFDVEIVGVRDATDEELKRGHLKEESSCCDSESSCC